jgi:copper chaperone CopZ
MKKVTFKIVDMHCTTCSITIDGDLEDMGGVKKAQTSYAKALTEVEYDPERISENELLKVIKQAGYTAEAVN